MVSANKLELLQIADAVAREKLIEELRRMAAERAGEAPAEEAAAAGPSLPERIADGTRAAAEQVLAEFGQAVDALAAIGTGPAPDWDAIGHAALDLGGLIVATMLVFVGLRRLARPLWARAAGWATQGSAGMVLLRRAVAVVIAAAIDAVNIVLAWLAGWALAAFVLGEPGAIEPRLSLFLNAFVAIEALKALLRVVFAARDEALRLLPIG